MRIAIDSRGATLYHGTGIGTYTNNLISEMLSINNKDKFTLFCTGKFNNDFEKNNIPPIHAINIKDIIILNFNLFVFIFIIITHSILNSF